VGRYIRQKKLKGLAAGVDVEVIHLDIPDEGDSSAIKDKVASLCEASDIRTTGIIVQLPVLTRSNFVVPEGDREALGYLHASGNLCRDVDGVHPCSEVLYNFKTSSQGFYNLPCTPQAVLELIQYHQVPLKGKRAVIIGRSSIVGTPLMNTLLQDEYQMTIVSPHKSDTNLKGHTVEADLLIVAAGHPSLITPDMIKPGAVLIDIGINRISNSSDGSVQLVGDISPQVKATFPLPFPSPPPSASLSAPPTLQSPVVLAL
jgi:methylenetetrahydrofolate dehydrogenase (NADP+) / methenyltetrahydrofolate cyclohydrolase